MSSDHEVEPDTTQSEIVIRTRGLRKNFESEGAPVRALRGVDFEMRRGDFVSVMGPSGCGKSTLLNLVAGLDAATDGELEVAGESLIGSTEVGAIGNSHERIWQGGST